MVCCTGRAWDLSGGSAHVAARIARVQALLSVFPGGGGGLGWRGRGGFRGWGGGGLGDGEGRPSELFGGCFGLGLGGVVWGGGVRVRVGAGAREAR